MMKVKICGITNYEDANNACKFGADALGFVFYKKSPRYIEPIKAKKIIEKLPPFVSKIALFVNETTEKIDEISQFIGADYAQIHFETDKNFYNNLKTKHIKVIRAKCYEDIFKYKTEYRIIDAFVEEYGGSGKRVNLEWFKNIDKSKIILAGGLTPKNLEEVLNLGFYGVDVSSGVEKSKGIKDVIKLKEFIEKVKRKKY